MYVCSKPFLLVFSSQDRKRELEPANSSRPVERSDRHGRRARWTRTRHQTPSSSNTENGPSFRGKCLRQKLQGCKLYANQGYKHGADVTHCPVTYLPEVIERACRRWAQPRSGRRRRATWMCVCASGAYDAFTISRRQTRATWVPHGKRLLPA